MTEEQMDRAFKLSLEHDTRQNRKEKGIPLAVTYNPAFRNLFAVMKKNFDII